MRIFAGRAEPEPVLAATVTSWSMSGCAVRQWVRPAYRRPCPPPRHGSPICLGQRALDKLVLRCAKERSEEHTSELQSRGHLVCRLLLEKKKPHSNEFN